MWLKCPETAINALGFCNCSLSRDELMNIHTASAGIVGRLSMDIIWKLTVNCSVSRVHRWTLAACPRMHFLFLKKKTIKQKRYLLSLFACVGWNLELEICCSSWVLVEQVLLQSFLIRLSELQADPFHLQVNLDFFWNPPHVQFPTANTDLQSSTLQRKSDQ